MWECKVSIHEVHVPNDDDDNDVFYRRLPDDIDILRRHCTGRRARNNVAVVRFCPRQRVRIIQIPETRLTARFSDEPRIGRLKRACMMRVHIVHI